MYTLDSDMFSLFEAQNPIIMQRVFAVPPDQRFTTAINVRERLDGWYGLLGRVKTEEDEARVYQKLVETVKICAMMRILPYDLAAIRRYKALQVQKLNIKAMDLRVGAIALEHNAIVVTRNTRDFARISDLRLEDWTQDFQ